MWRVKSNLERILTNRQRNRRRCAHNSPEAVTHETFVGPFPGGPAGRSVLLKLSVSLILFSLFGLISLMTAWRRKGIKEAQFEPFP